MILKSLHDGFRQLWKTKRMVLVYFLVNFFFALLLMLPFRAILSDFVGDSLMGTELGGRLNMDFLFEFLKHKRSVLSVVGALMLFVPIVYWLFNLFLSGGAFATFVSGKKYNPSLFWGNAAKYFGRFIRLFLWCLPIFVVLFLLQFLETAGEKIFFGEDPYQYVTYWGGWIKVGLRYISFILIWMVFDYARIYTVINDEHRTRISVWRGFLFAFAHLPQTFGLALLVFVIGGVALVIYNPIANLLSAPSSLIILVLFLWQQLYMIFRMMLRLTLYSGQLHLYRHLAAEPQSSRNFPDASELEMGKT